MARRLTEATVAGSVAGSPKPVSTVVKRVQSQSSGCRCASLSRTGGKVKCGVCGRNK